jgi:hypothetical protein
MLGKITRIIQEINCIIDELEKFENPEYENKLSQFKSINKIINKMETESVSIPEELVQYKKKLSEELQEFENPNENLRILKNELLNCVSQIKGNPRFGKEKKFHTREFKGRVDPNTELTSYDTLEEVLIKILTDMGGPVKSSVVIDKMEISLKDKLTSGDHECISSGEERWKNRTNWVRHQLIKKGMLKGDSPRGVWEINNKK